MLAAHGISGLLAGRYAVERLLGEGATATVHLARDRHAGISVAIKVLRPELAESGAAVRFLKEIKRTTSLDHPRILKVLDTGEHEGRPFFVLPYMEGGTLRHRLKREGQMAIDDALAIAASVAEALDAAHARGLVHLDVKPENILFTSGVACLGDFGIARVLANVYGEASTSAHVIRGTPAYMSPEQAAGEPNLDGRSDQYSLACVIYEMITGMPAFMGPTPDSVIRQRLVHKPRPLNVYRPSVSAGVQEVLDRALAPERADRFPTTSTFVAALRDTAPGAPNGHSQWRGRARFRLPAILAMGTALIGAGLVFGNGIGEQGGSPDEVTEPDTLRYAVILASSSDATGNEVSELLRESLARWRGIDVVPALHVADALARVGGEPVTDDRAREAALLLGAGRYAFVDLARSGDSLRVRTSILDSRTGRSLSDHFGRIAANLRGAESALSSLADAILLGSVAGAPVPHSTTSYPALREYRAAQGALAEWDLVAADSGFRLAVQYDPDFALAHLWLAQLRFWKQVPVARWLAPASKALTLSDRLAWRDSAAAVALASLARGDRITACGEWRRITRRASHDFAAWFGLGSCLANDSMVVRDVGSPSGWAFRSSYAEGLRAYERAFTLLPSVHHLFAESSFEGLQRLLMTSGSLKVGRAEAGDTTRFLAYASWHGDSLRFTPLPAREFHSARAWTRTQAVNEAMLRQRQMFHALATMWRSEFPDGPEALEAVAIALDLLGNESAIDSLQVARRLAEGRKDAAFRIAVTEIGMRLKRALPSDTADIRDTRLLADSLLSAAQAAATATASQASILAGLAALTGRAAVAANYERDGVSPTVPASIARVAPGLLAFAAMGGPTDSIHELEVQLRAAIDRQLLDAERGVARNSWLMRAAMLAIPQHEFEAPADLWISPHYLTRLVRAWYERDAGRANATLEALRAERERGGIGASEIAIDALYTETAVLAALGDTAVAVNWVTPFLESMQHRGPNAFNSVARAGPLVRLLALRAQLAARAGDLDAARRWAWPVIILWSGADEFQEETVQLMREIVAIR